MEDCLSCDGRIMGWCANCVNYPPTETFGQRLRMLRQQKGLTQEGLAVRLNSSQNMITKYENDLVNPGALILQSMADELGVTMDYLWRGKK